MTQGPPAGHEKMMTPFLCTEDWAAPALDIALGVLGLVYVLEVGGDTDSPGGATSGAIFAGIFGASAGLAIKNVSRCQAALRALTERQAEAAAALAARKQSADLIGVQSVLITGGLDTMTVGTWTQLVAQAYDSTGAVIVDRSFAWSSSNDTIASVSADGLVRARRVGTAVITAHAGNVFGTASVVVAPAH